jgi:aminopeptidase N
VTVVLIVVLVAGCSSTTGGVALPGTTLAGSTTATTSSSSSTSSSAADGGITVPPSRTSPSAQVVEPDGATGTVGSPGIGDPYYPLAGNGGYQVDSYSVDLSYDPDSNNLQSTAVITGTVTSTEGLTQFNLDLQPTMTVTEVTVNDGPATFDQQDAELVVTPASALTADSPLKVTVTYGGQPGLVKGGTSGLSDGGWYRTDSGGAFVAGEPTGASTWFPVNEHPADTATFQLTATVPDKWKVISNGVKQTEGLPDPGPDKAVFGWKLSEPVASYLTTIYIDTFTEVNGTLSDGKPVYSAIGPGVTGAETLANDTQRVVDVLSGYFGPYPFESAGGIFVNTETGFALETATRPVYGGSQLTNLDTVVHELAHQWFGDDVTIERWSDICLNECFASYGTWLWNEKVNGGNLDATWKQQMARVERQPDFWRSPLVDMGPGAEFTRVYDRGPLALHALRNEMGDEAFFALLKGWVDTYGGKNATFDELEAYASSIAGKDLGPFMDAWFRGTTVPAMEFRYPGDLGG